MAYSPEAIRLKEILDAIVRIIGRAEIHHQDIRQFYSRADKLWALLEELKLPSTYENEKEMKEYLKGLAQAMPGQIKQASKPVEPSKPHESTAASQPQASQT